LHCLTFVFTNGVSSPPEKTYIEEGGKETVIPKEVTEVHFNSWKRANGDKELYQIEMFNYASEQIVDIKPKDWSLRHYLSQVLMINQGERFVGAKVEIDNEHRIFACKIALLVYNEKTVKVEQKMRRSMSRGSVSMLKVDFTK
jgi:hypothetical protein